MHPALKKLGTMGIVAGLAYLTVFGMPPSLLGEVVEVETYDPRGVSFQTSAWIVDGHGDHWLRAGSPEASWLARLRAEPRVQITREGVRTSFRAEIAEGSADRVNFLMREKYGRSDELMMALRDPSEVTAIRLVPLTQAQGWSEQYP